MLYNFKISLNTPNLFHLLPSITQFKHISNHFYCTNNITVEPPKPFILRQCIALLQSCATSLHKLKQIHAFSIKHFVPLTNPLLAKHLIFFAISLSENNDNSNSNGKSNNNPIWSRQSGVLYAHKIFSQIENPNIFTWNTMIRGYAFSETPLKAIELYTQMRVNKINPDTHTFPFLLKAICKVFDLNFGAMIHCDVIKNGFISLVFVKNGLVHMYANFELIENAHKVFDEMSMRNLVTWNSMINGFAFNGKNDEVLMFFREMSEVGVKPDGFTMVSLLCACAELGALALGRRVHVYMLKVGLYESLHAGNALLDFYAKCGRIRDARVVFGELREKSVVSWTSLVVGLAMNGVGNEAIEVFKEMEREGFCPSDVTLVGVLYGCSHSGMVDEGFDYFNNMKDKYGVTPRIEHYGCMVDLLGRAGKVKEAYEFIKDMPMQPNTVIWRTLLGACSLRGHLDLAQHARDKLLELDPKHCGDYVLLSNLYASERRWTDVHQLRSAMVKEGVRKTPGVSLVELRNQVHEFVMGDRSHAQDREIYAMLREITKVLRSEGYVPQTVNVLADIEEEEKETALTYHSEKIAIAFMLINTLPNTPITVIKNLRACADCHLAIKLISKYFDREIVVRDRSRFHHFKHGDCSCREYW